jgi:hypothetical protein
MLQEVQYPKDTGPVYKLLSWKSGYGGQGYGEGKSNVYTVDLHALLSLVLAQNQYELTYYRQKTARDTKPLSPVGFPAFHRLMLTKLAAKNHSLQGVDQSGRTTPSEAPNDSLVAAERLLGKESDLLLGKETKSYQERITLKSHIKELQEPDQIFVESCEEVVFPESVFLERNNTGQTEQAKHPSCHYCGKVLTAGHESTITGRTELYCGFPCINAKYKAIAATA